MTFADKILVSFAMLLLPLLYLELWSNDEPASYIQIISSSQQVSREPLDHDHVIRIAGNQGDSIIQIQNHKARFIQSPCKHKVCIQTGWISHAGEAAVCIPNQVLIEMVGLSSRYDSINY